MGKHARRKSWPAAIGARVAPCACVLLAVSCLIPLAEASREWYDGNGSPAVSPATATLRGLKAAGDGGAPVSQSIVHADEEIPYRTVRRMTSQLPKGVEQVQAEGRNGSASVTRLETVGTDGRTDSYPISRAVTRPPIDRVVLVGEAVTVPAGEMQRWCHDYMLANGYGEEDFMAAVKLIDRESGWNVTARNPSGAYGLPQAMPGDGMSAYGTDWETNYRTQLRWFFDYCATKYGGVRQAWAFWLNHGWY